MNFIYIKNNSISDNMCKSIITLFEKYQKNNRYIINHQSLDCEYIYNYLYYEINININKYIKELSDKLKHVDFNFFTNDHFFINNFCVEKFIEKNINNNKLNVNVFDLQYKTYSVMRFIWILNNIDNEIVFLKDYKVKTSIGQLFIFPSFWSFPFSDINVQYEKYIIMGYIESSGCF